MLKVNRQRNWSQLPRALIALFVMALGLQIYSHRHFVSIQSLDYKPLQEPLSRDLYHGLSMGSEQLFSYLLALRLQTHDNQVGRHLRYQNLDYGLLVKWLDLIYRLNMQSEYPMFLATRVYSQNRDRQQLQKLLKYIDSNFEHNPQKFWRYQAEATVIAKHALGDLELALRMAEKLYRQPDSVEMPHWARDMHFLLLADLNEYEAGIAIIRALLESNSISDVDEIRFLKEKLSYFQQKLSEIQLNDKVHE